MSQAAAAWDFAVALYGRPGVATACLALQDRRGADVIVLLELVHRATGGAGVAGDERLRLALAAIAPWRGAAIQPLRTLRRSLKGWRFTGAAADVATEPARQAIAAAERAAERAALSAFVRLLGDGPSLAANEDPLAAAALALAAYWRMAGLVHDQADRTALAAILAEAFPGRPAAAEAIERAFSA